MPRIKILPTCVVLKNRLCALWSDFVWVQFCEYPWGCKHCFQGEILPAKQIILEIQPNRVVKSIGSGVREPFIEILDLPLGS